jgi:hypothetical protein
MSESNIKLHNILSKMEGGQHRLASSNTLHQTEFVSNHEDRTYEHFIQVSARELHNKFTVSRPCVLCCPCVRWVDCAHAEPCHQHHHLPLHRLIG